jgi:hypothetical protein
MSLINVVKWAERRGIKLRGADDSKERMDHLEELRCQAWREMGFELRDTPRGRKWKKVKVK